MKEKAKKEQKGNKILLKHRDEYEVGRFDLPHPKNANKSIERRGIGQLNNERTTRTQLIEARAKSEKTYILRKEKRSIKKTLRTIIEQRANKGKTAFYAKKS